MASHSVVVDSERRIAEKTGRGAVCFISNYGWLDGLSFTVIPEQYLEAFDAVRIDCQNADKYWTGKVALLTARPTRCIFSTEGDAVGIQVGTAIATMLRKSRLRPADDVQFRPRLGKGQADGVPGDAGSGTGHALRTCCAKPAELGPPVRANGRERGLDRLAGAARSVSGVVSRSQDKLATHGRLAVRIGAIHH